MAPTLGGTASLFAGAIALGVVHGAESGHGWPVAATYALDRPQTWLHGIAASTLLGLGHLVSSIAVVVVFFLAKDYDQDGTLGRVAGWLPFVGGHSHDHPQLSAAEVDTTGLWSIVGTAIVLGFAHEEEFEIIRPCTAPHPPRTPICLDRYWTEGAKNGTQSRDER